MSDLKKMYSNILGDHFPMEMTISFGGQTLVYRKKTWKINIDYLNEKKKLMLLLHLFK